MRKADNLSPSCAVVTKSGNLNFLGPPGPVQACNGMLYLYLYITKSPNGFCSNSVQSIHILNIMRSCVSEACKYLSDRLLRYHCAELLGHELLFLDFS